MSTAISTLPLDDIGKESRRPLDMTSRESRPCCEKFEEPRAAAG
jgi:hypothetical protein